MPSLVLRCAFCGVCAPVLRVEDGFRHHAFHYLCGTCRTRVLAAGDARARRAAVTSRRVELLLERFPGLHIDEVARRRVSLRGELRHGEHPARGAWITVRDSARESEAERFVVRVALSQEVVLEPTAWPAALRVAPCAGSPRRVVDRGSWLWCGFRHLGNGDLLHVIEVMCDAATSAESLQKCSAAEVLRAKMKGKERGDWGWGRDTRATSSPSLAATFKGTVRHVARRDDGNTTVPLDLTAGGRRSSTRAH